MTKMLNVGWSNKGNCAFVDFNFMRQSIAEYKELQIKEQVCWVLSIRKPQNKIICLLSQFECSCINKFKQFNAHISISKNYRLFDIDIDMAINCRRDNLIGEYNIKTICRFINILFAILGSYSIIKKVWLFKTPLLNFKENSCLK